MRNMRRKDREKTTDFALKVADTCAYAAMATVNPDGSPYCIPLSFVREGDWLYFHSALDGHKIDNLKFKNKVCVSCVGTSIPMSAEYSMEYTSAVINGTAEEVTDREEKLRALRLVCLRYTPDNMAGFDAAIERNFARTAVWKIHIDEISGKARAR